MLNVNKLRNIRRIIAITMAIAAVMTATFAWGTSTHADAADFILGVDVSELIAQEQSGVVYYDADWNERDVLAVLSDYSVDHIRLRVWNDPFDADGNGYGGGNINAETAAIISARAADYGMKTLIDFHYSDFWADPSRQIAPKAWSGMSVDEKRTALAEYTKASLSTILDAGGDVDMVQIGNETNNGIAGEYNLNDMAALIAAGCKAAREVSAEHGRDILISIHLTDPQNSYRIEEILNALSSADADYDAVGLSYYPYWHGTYDQLTTTIKHIQSEFNKLVFIAETSWPFTSDDGDGWPNVIDSDPGMYDISRSGQAQEIIDLYNVAGKAGAIGIFYWGGIWTPIGDNVDENRVKWEQYGSGWASSYANEYDPDHVGEYYGGSAWDNQALFDFDGKPMQALKHFPDLAASTTFDTDHLYIADQTEEVETAAETGDDAINYVINGGFEDGDHSMWITESYTNEIPFDYQDFVNDAHSGTVAFHYWSQSDMDFSIEQEITGLDAGHYQASVWSQGGDMKDAELVLYARTSDNYYEANFMNTSWANWQHPIIDDIEITDGSVIIGVRIKCAALGWGTIDDFELTMTK